MNRREKKRIKQKIEKDEERLRKQREEEELSVFKMTPFGLKYKFNLPGAKTYYMNSLGHRGSFL